MGELIIDVWSHVCLTYRKTILLLLTTITAATAAQLPHARFDDAIEIWFLDDDPTMLAHHRLREMFGSDELIVIGVETPDVFAPQVFALIDRISRAVAAAPHVENVFSLTSIESITSDGELLRVGELVELPLDEQAVPAVRERALTNELYVGNVVSADGDFAGIIARLPHAADDFDAKR